MAIAVNAVETFNGINVADPFSWSHTVGSGDDRIIVVLCMTDPDEPTSVTVGGVACTKLGSAQMGGGPESWNSIWYLVAPTSGAQTVEVNTGGGSFPEVACSSIDLSGVDASTPWGALSTSVPGDTDDPVSLDVASAVDDLVIDSITFGSTRTATAGGGQTERANHTPDSSSGSNYAGQGVSTKPGEASTTAMSWTFSAATHRTLLAAAIKPAASGGGAVTVEPTFIASTATVYEPTVQPGGAVGQTVAPTFIASAAEVFEPTVAAGGGTPESVEPTFIESTAVVYAPQIGDKVIDLFFIGGQSNALYRDVGGVAPDPIPGTAYDMAWNGLSLSSMDDLPGGFGPAFAVEYWSLTGRVSAYHNRASGSSAQQEVVAPSNNWSDDFPNRYSAAEAAWLDGIANLETLGYTVTPRGLLWDQGGQDAIFMDPPDNLGSAEGYETQFLALIARMRAAFGAGLKIWIVRLGRPDSDPDNIYWEAIRDKQEAVVAADPDVHFMHTEAATWDSIYYYDNLHYTQDGYDKIGTEGAQAVVAEIDGVTVAPTFIASTAEVFEPAIVEGDAPVTVEPGFIASTAQVYAPTLTEGTPDPVAVEPAFIASTAEVYTPEIVEGLASGDAVRPAFIASTGQVFEPSVQYGAVTIEVPFIASTAQVFSPRVGAAVELTGPFTVTLAPSRLTVTLE